MGLDETLKGKGASRGQDTRDIDGSYSYPLVDPRPEEAPDIDDSTVVQCTGADRSLVHPLDMMDKTLYSRHLEDEERDDDQDTDGPGARQDEERYNDQDATDPRQDIQHAGTVREAIGKKKQISYGILP